MHGSVHEKAWFWVICGAICMQENLLELNSIKFPCKGLIVDLGFDTLSIHTQTLSFWLETIRKGMSCETRWDLCVSICRDIYIEEQMFVISW